MRSPSCGQGNSRQLPFLFFISDVQLWVTVCLPCRFNTYSSLFASIWSELVRLKKNTCYVFHMCRAITFTVRSLKYVGLPFSLPLPCNISWCTVLYVPRLPSTYSLQSAPSPIIKARNSLTGCRILLFQFSFEISPTLIMLLEILQTRWGLSVKNCLLRGKRAFFVYLVRRTWAATYLQLAWKASGSRILTQVFL